MWTTITPLDAQQLQDLSGRSDPLGVLSVYVTVEPGPRSRAAAVDVRNRYRELQQRIGRDGTGPPTGMASALELLHPELERVTDPAAPGRGRILFAGLGGGWALRMHSQVPVSNRVVLDDGPFIHPLLELLDEGRPAGVVMISGETAMLMEWRLGELERRGERKRDEIEAAHERAGQIGGGPPGQFHTPVTEHRQAREQELAQRFLGDVAETISAMAEDRGWQRIVVSGEDRWTGAFIARLPAALREMAVREPRVLTGLDQEDVRRAVTDRLHDEHTAHEQRTAEWLRDAGLSRAAALGLSEVVAALNEGRAAHLVYDPAIRYAGSVGPDGTLRAGAELGAGGVPGVPEPRLAERLVERALATGARVSPVEGAADGALRECDGIGAFLRW